MARWPVTRKSLLFQEWRAADRQAYAVEKSLIERSLQSLDGLCVCPLQEERDAARRTRDTANDLFHLAIAEMDQLSKDLRK